MAHQKQSKRALSQSEICVYKWFLSPNTCENWKFYSKMNFLKIQNVDLTESNTRQEPPTPTFLNN